MSLRRALRHNVQHLNGKPLFLCSTPFLREYPVAATEKDLSTLRYIYENECRDIMEEFREVRNDLDKLNPTFQRMCKEISRIQGIWQLASAHLARCPRTPDPFTFSCRKTVKHSYPYYHAWSKRGTTKWVPSIGLLYNPLTTASCQGIQSVWIILVCHVYSIAFQPRAVFSGGATAILTLRKVRFRRSFCYFLSVI